MDDRTPRRKVSPRPLPRAAVPRAVAPALRGPKVLPTFACVAAALALSTLTSSPASAGETTWFDEPVAQPATDAGAGAGAGADAGPAADAGMDADPGDAVWCPPDPNGYAMAGGIGPVEPRRVHGTGCGCTALTGEDDGPTEAAATLGLLVFLLRRRLRLSV